MFQNSKIQNSKFKNISVSQNHGSPSILLYVRKMFTIFRTFPWFEKRTVENLNIYWSSLKTQDFAHPLLSSISVIFLTTTLGQVGSDVQSCSENWNCPLCLQFEFFFVPQPDVFFWPLIPEIDQLHLVQISCSAIAWLTAISILPE